MIIERRREDDQDREYHQQLAGAGSEKTRRTLEDLETHIEVIIILIIIMLGLATPLKARFHASSYQSHDRQVTHKVWKLN